MYTNHNVIQNQISIKLELFDGINELYWYKQLAVHVYTKLKLKHVMLFFLSKWKVIPVQLYPENG